tara:strand:- start:239046 stop:239705 length:660 start_codon:yes stop_codon:yes gene_type:complete
LAAIIHVKLTGEGDFGPVDLECAIPPARLPFVMAALFGSPNALRAGGAGDLAGASLPRGGAAAKARDVDHGGAAGGAGTGLSQSFVPAVDGAGDRTDDRTSQSGGMADFDPMDMADPASFLTGYIGSLGDLVARLQPRGFAETILIGAIWLHYRDGRSVVTRDDLRRLLRRQEHLRMPKNFGRDFQTAIARGYVEAVSDDGGYVVARGGYQWFRNACIK